jgi:hypothetical protein
MSTMPARLARCAAPYLPESVELVHDSTTDELVAIRYNGVTRLIYSAATFDYTLRASESAIPYRLGSVVAVELTDAVDEAEEEGSDLLRDRLREMENANDAAYLDAATWKQRAAKLADDLAVAYRKIDELLMLDGTQ